MSDHKVEVVKLETIYPHPDKETTSLELVKVWDYVAVARKGQYKPGDLAVYIEPDFVVKLSRPEFSFLQSPGGTKEKHRITTKRLRGVWSQGLLIPAPEGSVEGQDVRELLEIERYEPPPPNMKPNSKGAWLGGGLQEAGPVLKVPYYDLENLQKYTRLLEKNEEVVVSEKIHGSNSRFMFSEGRMWLGSRTTWKKPTNDYVVRPLLFSGFKTPEAVLEFMQYLQEDIQRAAMTQKDSPEKVFALVNVEWLEKNKDNLPPFEVKGDDRQTKFSTAWHRALECNPWIEEWCRNHPNLSLYGEIFGKQVQGHLFNYGVPEGDVGFRVFDIFDPTKVEVQDQWMNNWEMHEPGNSFVENLKLVPLLYRGLFDFDMIKTIAEEDSVFEKGHIREGVVLKTKNERFSAILGGRIALKYVSNRYYGKS